MTVPLGVQGMTVPLGVQEVPNKFTSGTGTERHPGVPVVQLRW